MPEYDPLLTMSALNMAIVSLHRITSSGDRLILDREYNGIINNLRMGEINADPELTGLYQEIVRVIHRGRLRDDIRAEIKDEYSVEKRKGIREIITGNILKSFSTNPVKWLGKLAMSSASEYFTQQKEKGDHAKWQLGLKHEELDEYDELQRKLLGSSWSLLRQYKLPDSYRLTQNALVKFSAAMNEAAPSKRQRMMKYLEDEFSMYAPYWFYLAKSSREAGSYDEAGQYLSKFGEVWRPVLRKDPYRAEAMKYRIEGLMRSGVTQDNAGKVLACLEEMRANTELEDWANNIFAGMLYFTLGHKDKAEKCVMCNIDFGFEEDISRRVLDGIRTGDSQEATGALPESSERSAWWDNYMEAKSRQTYDNEPNTAGRWSIARILTGWLKATPKPAKSYVPSEKLQPIILTRKPEPEMLTVSVPEISRKPDSPAIRNEVYSAARSGDPEAQLQLGMKYFSAKTSEAERDALEWLKRSAAQENAEAQYTLARIYREGKRKNFQQSLLWCKKAAGKNHLEAMEMLGDMYIASGDKKSAQYWHDMAEKQKRATVSTSPVNLPEPVKPAYNLMNEQTLRVKSMQGDEEAQYYLGLAFEKKNDYDEALTWYSKAAEHGHSKARDALIALLISRGNYCSEHYESGKARNYYEQAAEMGSVEAMFKLAEILKGAHDDDEAAFWYGEAASQGHIEAMMALGDMDDTIGEYKAYMYYCLAGLFGRRKAKFKAQKLVEDSYSLDGDDCDRAEAEAQRRRCRSSV